MEKDKTYSQYSNLLKEKLDKLDTETGSTAISETITHLTAKKTPSGLSNHLISVLEDYLNENLGGE